MLPEKPKEWSQNLRNQTVVCIDELSCVTPDGKVYFKNIDGRKSFALILDLIKNNIILHSCLDDNRYTFETVDNLIESGWVID